MNDILEALALEVARNAEVDASAIVLLNGLTVTLGNLAAQINDPRLSAFVDDLKAQNDALAAAVVANTPAAPAVA